ncbi:MAG: hypothetical protein QXI11_03315 [Thermoproteota archaeon]
MNKKFVLIIVAIVAFAFYFYLQNMGNPTEMKPAELYIDLNVPPMFPGSPTELYVNVTNLGGNARNVEIYLIQQHSSR